MQINRKHVVLLANERERDRDRDRDRETERVLCLIDITTPRASGRCLSQCVCSSCHLYKYELTYSTIPIASPNTHIHKHKHTHRDIHTYLYF